VFIYAVLLVATCESLTRVGFEIPFIRDRVWENEDFTWRRWWVNRHAGGMPAETVFEWAPDRFDPMLGWLPTPNLRNISFASVPQSTNSRGLRGTTEYAYEAPRARRRIVLLGDSFTFGSEVRDEETYAHRLQQMLPAVDVLNLGVNGYGHDQMLIYFEQEGRKYAPDVVILGFLARDMDRNTLAFRDYAKPRFVSENGQLTLTNSPVPPPDVVLRWDWIRPRLLSDVWSLTAQRAKTRGGRDKAERQEVTLLILDRLAAAIRAAGAVGVFCYLPSEKELVSAEPTVEGEAFLFDYCRSNGQVRCFSARPHFARRAQEGVSFKTTGHYDASGHLIAAEAIRDYLKEQGIVTADVVLQ
jgi:hypothetical protein